MNENIYNYAREVASPEILSVLNVLTQFGEAIPRHYLIEHEDSVKEAVDAGFVFIQNNKIHISPRGQKTVETLILLAKQEGEI